MIWIIIIVAIVAFFLYNGYKGAKDIKNVEKYGGILNKYNILIEFIMTNKKLKLNQINSNNIEIGYNFIGNGYVKFKLIEISGILQIKYESKDLVDGVQRLIWKFSENEDQVKMAETISKDMFMHNLILQGTSKEEALKMYSEFINQ